MTYIYDVLLNFTEKRLIEFYEWSDNDTIINIKKIPIFRISPQQMYDLLNYNIKIENQLLEEIKNNTSYYKKDKYFEYAALFTDINKVVGITFDKDGYIHFRSGLLLDEEEDNIDCNTIAERTLKYQKEEKLTRSFYTREETKKINYIINELDKIYKEENKEKLNYLYNEIFPKQRLSFKNKYLKIKTEVECNFSKKYNILYEILKLSCTKK